MAHDLMPGRRRRSDHARIPLAAQVVADDEERRCDRQRRTQVEKARQGFSQQQVFVEAGGVVDNVTMDRSVTAGAIEIDGHSVGSFDNDGSIDVFEKLGHATFARYCSRAAAPITTNKTATIAKIGSVL